MPIAPKKVSELSELTTLADGDKVPVIDDSASTPATKNKWMSLSTLKAWIGALANPMTTAGDLIVGGESGAPGRLEKGSDGQVLKMVSGAIAWAAHAVGMTNPMTTAGDLIVGGESGAAGRLAKGTDGQVLKVVSGSLAWADDEVGEGGGGSTLPVADTTALVKDPVDETKLLRLDAGNVPTESTVVLQSPGVSAVVGLIVLERQLVGDTVVLPATVGLCPGGRSGRVVGFTAFYPNGGSYPVYLRLKLNDVDQGAAAVAIYAESSASAWRYGRGSVDFAFGLSDNLSCAIVGDGSTDYGGSGPTGSSASGPLYLQLEIVYSPA